MQRFRPYFHYLRPVRGHLVIALLCLCVYSAANGFGIPYVVPKIFGPIFDEPERNRSLSDIALLAMILPGVFLIRGIAGFASSYLFQFIGTRVLEAIRLDYFDKLQRLPLAYLPKQ